MINDAILYIEYNFGTKILSEDLNDLAKMPIYLSKGYSYKRITLFNEYFLLMYSDNNESEKINMIQQHKATIKNILNINYPIVLIFDKLNSNQRNKLIYDKVSFIIPGSMIFIFEIGSIIRTRQQMNFSKETDNLEILQMSPSTQALFLYLITTYDLNSSMEKIANKLDITKMSVSRGFNELHKLGLIEKNTYDNNIKYYFAKKSSEVWNEAQKYLNNPVYKTMKFHRKTIENKFNMFTVSGESALSKFTMISEPRIPVYGITKKKFKQLKLHDDELYIFDDKSIIIQIFNYNLPIIDNVLHPLSIYLIFKEDNDSRIRYEMKTMIDNYFRNLEI